MIGSHHVLVERVDLTNTALLLFGCHRKSRDRTITYHLLVVEQHEISFIANTHSFSQQRCTYCYRSYKKHTHTATMVSKKAVR